VLDDIFMEKTRKGRAMKKDAAQSILDISQPETTEAMRRSLKGAFPGRKM
jgi:hypothetical protein